MKPLSLLGLMLLTTGLGACAPVNALGVEISIDLKEFAFQPSEIEVPQGALVRVILRNSGTIEHDWAVQEIDVTTFNAGPQAGHDMHAMTNAPKLHAATQVGQTARLEFRPEKAGTYEILCTVAGHKEAGMKGRLIVKARS